MEDESVRVATKKPKSKKQDFGPKNVIYDMETQDPDDFFAMCFLLSHPDVILRAVTIYPGSKMQVGLVKEVLKHVGRSDVLVGTNNPDYPKSCVSPFHFSVLPNIKEAQPDGSANDVLYKTFTKFPNTTIITGGPPFNLESMLKAYPDAKVPRWVAQGGFAGSNVVPEDCQLDKFKGKQYCMSANWSSTPTLNYLVSCDRILRRVICAKNVCHGIVYDMDFHEKVAAVPNKTKGLQFIYDGMQLYLQKKSSGKMFHDPLAAAVAVDESICEFYEVQMMNQKSEWGCEKKEGTNTFIAIRVDLPKFIQTICTVE